MVLPVLTGEIVFEDEEWGDDKYQIRYVRQTCCCPQGCYPDILEYKEPKDKYWCRLELEGEHKHFISNLLEKAGVTLSEET